MRLQGEKGVFVVLFDQKRRLLPYRNREKEWNLLSADNMRKGGRKSRVSGFPDEQGTRFSRWTGSWGKKPSLRDGREKEEGKTKKKVGRENALIHFRVVGSPQEKKKPELGARWPLRCLSQGGGGPPSLTRKKGRDIFLKK